MQPDEYREKRKFARFEADISVESLVMAGQPMARVRTHDISTQGIGLLIEEQPRVGTQMLMTLQVPDSSEQIQVSGEVVWLQQASAGRFRAGLKLLDRNLDPIPLVMRSLLVKARQRQRLSVPPQVSI